MGASPRPRAIVRLPPPEPSLEARAAEARLRRLVEELEAAERQHARELRELAAFERGWAEATRAAFARLEEAQRLARGLGRLEAEVERLAAALAMGEAPAAGRRARASARAARALRPGRGLPPGAPPALAEGPPTGAEPEEPLKTLYHRLARRLHPDLWRGDERERARRSSLMARANEAYARGDRAALEILAERIGAGELDGAPSDAERLAHLARRAARVAAERARTAAAHARLRASRPARLRDEAARRARGGGDLAAEARAGAERDARAAELAALASLDRVLAGARLLDRARAAALARRGGSGARDPVARSPLVRAAARPSRRTTAPARLLARTLAADAARPEPWEAALALLATLGELAGRAPDALATAGRAAERWDALREAWPTAPDLPGALARLPRHLALGLRLRRDGVEAGLQLASPDLVHGVRAALEDDAAVRALAARVLAALGPRTPCRRCRADVYAVHLARVRGVDAVHGLVCPRCASALRTFVRYGPLEGLEALLPVSLAVGLVVEQAVRVGPASLLFGMLPAERARLTARGLARRVAELCLAPHGIDLPEDALGFHGASGPLRPFARVPAGTVRLVVDPAAGVGARELVERMRSAVASRFRGTG